MRKKLREARKDTATATAKGTSDTDSEHGDVGDDSKGTRWACTRCMPIYNAMYVLERLAYNQMFCRGEMLELELKLS